ncbi:MAG: NUDIX hydrolase, partial [Thiohalorhabdus sp.]
MEGPRCTVDVIIHDPSDRVLLIERKNPPYGWALPGGFVDPGEDLTTAVRREAAEETGLELAELYQFATYSAPDRDPRG